MGDRGIWYHGMQFGAEYMVHEQGGTSERGECDRVNELFLCTGAGIYAIQREVNYAQDLRNRNNNWWSNNLFYLTRYEDI